MTVWYNENDPYPAQWLRNLMAAGHIREGTVDDRDIRTLPSPAALAGVHRAHFFAGIAGWEFALRLADWPDDTPVWTGSCPCQPFSVAGKGRGASDARDLWPAWFRLIRECRPLTVVGEQVPGAIGFGWLDRVCADLEGEGYACGAVVLGAHSVGAPHIRNRLWWVAHAQGAERDGQRAESNGTPGGLADRRRLVQPHSPRRVTRRQTSASVGYGCSAESAGGGLDNAYGDGFAATRLPSGAQAASRATGTQPSDAGGLGLAQGGQAPGGLQWQDTDTIACLDGAVRRVAPGVPLVADGFPGRAAQLRALGNAIVPQTAALFLRAVLDALKGPPCPLPP